MSDFWDIVVPKFILEDTQNNLAQKDLIFFKNPYEIWTKKIYIVGILVQLATKNYTGRFDLVQNLFEL